MQLLHYDSVRLKNGEVRIKTRYAGINYAGNIVFYYNPNLELYWINKNLDILACQGKYQEKSKPPFIPGLEVSGEIVECCGCSHLKVGDRVFCIFTANGAFSEECVVKESQCFVVPPVPSISWIA